jgi:hypothetical protein
MGDSMSNFMSPNLQEDAPNLCELVKVLGGMDLLNQMMMLTQPGRKVRIINTLSGRSLYAQAGSDWDIGVGASSFRDGPFADAVWEIRPVQPDSRETTYRIVNSHSHRCLYAQVDKDGQDGFGASSISQPDWPDSHWHVEDAKDPDIGFQGPSCNIVNDFSKRSLLADNENWDRGLGARQGAQQEPQAQWTIIGADLAALLALLLQVVADVAKGVQYSNPNVAKVMQKVHEVFSEKMFSSAMMNGPFPHLDQQAGGEVTDNQAIEVAVSEVQAKLPVFLQQVDELLARAKAVELIRAVIKGDDIDLQPVKQLMDDLANALVDFVNSDPMKRLGQLMPSELLKWAES